MQDTTEPLDAAGATEFVRSQLLAEQFETGFESDAGRMLAVVSNGERAMVVLFQEIGDAGEHAIDPSMGTSESGGYVLSNGQHDTYPDRDTVPLEIAM